MKYENTPARDREATRQRLIEAVGELLSRRGFTALGVNSVARQAGVDKVLIYRYFGGLPQLIRAFGKEGGFWPDAEEILGGSLDEIENMKPAKRFAALARGYARAIRRRPLTLEIMAWEMVERNELTAELERIREESMLRLLRVITPEPVEPADPLPDIEAISAIFGAAINYLAVRSRHIHVFSGVDALDRPEGWKRLETAMELIVNRLFEPLY
jgi:AcrR family transcriptional regulator